MKLFDTHCHFESVEREVIAEQLRRAKAVGVERILAVGGSVRLNESAKVAREIGENDLAMPKVEMALGWDRDAVETNEFVLPRLSGATAAEMTALGEIGLDYHYSPTTREAQLKLLAAELALARQFDLPVIIHTREADEDTVRLLKMIPSRGIIHSYTGSAEYARKFLDLGFYISFSGIVTFKTADNVRAAMRVVPDNRLLIETDSPYLAPVPMRGRENEPALIEHTCRFVAGERGMSAEELAELTFKNGEKALCKAM